MMRDDDDDDDDDNTESYGARAFSVFTPREYDKLPNSVTSANTLNAFKLGLKTHLLELAYND